MNVNTKVKLTIFGYNGKKINEFTIDEFTFRKDSSLCREHSLLLQKGMEDVSNGGAIFIERVWKI